MSIVIIVYLLIMILGVGSATVIPYEVYNFRSLSLPAPCRKGWIVHVYTLLDVFALSCLACSIVNTLFLIYHLSSAKKKAIQAERSILAS